MRPKSPNSGDILFRYGDFGYMHAMVEHGSIRIGPASFYRDLESDAARADEECAKTCYMPGQYTRVTTQDGKEIPVIGDLQRKIQAPNYYILCMSCDWDPILFEDFGSDACVVIRDSEKFAERLDLASRSQLEGWYFHHNPVQYFDPYQMVRNEYFDAAMSKDFRFAYQREYRFLWMHMHGEEAREFKFLDLGQLHELAELHRRL